MKPEDLHALRPIGLVVLTGLALTVVLALLSIGLA